MSLIHLRTRICGGLLMGARLGVCGAVVGFELAEKGHRTCLGDLRVEVCCCRRVC